MTATADGTTKPLEGHIAFGENNWQLYRVGLSGSKPQLTAIATRSDAQESTCDGRASGTAFVSAGGELRAYCSQKLGTTGRASVRSCLLPFVPPQDSCDEWHSAFTDWDCAKDFAKNLFLPGVECADILWLDSHMSFAEQRPN